MSSRAPRPARNLRYFHAIRHRHRLKQLPCQSRMAIKRLNTRHTFWPITPFWPIAPKVGFRRNKKGFEVTSKPLQADKARFELAEAFTSHAFEACSLDRSDTYPLCYLKTSNFIILPQLWRLSNPIEGFLRCLRLLGVSYSREHCVALCEDGCADSVRKSALCE